jgi:hypothetical protein
VFLPGSTAADGYYGTANVSMWGPATGVNNGYTNASPTGGNFIANDADYGTAAVTQTINGLTIGHWYRLSFAWAAAQQSGFTGATTEAWAATLGSQTFNTTTYNLPSQGFSGWMNASYVYYATATSEVLSFLASGAPQVPPFALLANVTLVDAPEPGSLAVLASAMVGLVALARRRRPLKMAGLSA